MKVPYDGMILTKETVKQITWKWYHDGSALKKFIDAGWEWKACWKEDGCYFFIHARKNK